LLYALRDGQLGDIIGAKVGRRTVTKPELMLLYANKSRSAQAEAAYQKLVRTGKLVISPPVERAPKIWEEFKRARSMKEIREVSRRIRRWASQHMPGDDWETRFPGALISHADEVLSAKQLPNYPKAPGAKRPRSDNKRIEFFSKILAGVMLGIAPITAAKRLSRWHHYPKDRVEEWLEKTGEVGGRINP
jgi:hypothetical protein